MPRYFFQIDDGNSAQVEEGMELETLAVAKCEAVKLAGRMLCDSAGTFWDTEQWKLTASDENGLTLFCLMFIGIDAPVVQAETISPPMPTS